RRYRLTTEQDIDQLSLLEKEPTQLGQLALALISLLKEFQHAVIDVDQRIVHGAIEQFDFLEGFLKSFEFRLARSHWVSNVLEPRQQADQVVLDDVAKF